MDESLGAVSITHQGNDKAGTYTAHIAGEAVTGILEWERDPRDEDVRIATHTIVPKAIGGRGIAAQLVERLITDAREQQFRINPQCWYVAKKFDENPHWADLRA